MTPTECLITYGEAWFERDPQRRADVLRRCCTDDIVFVDPGLGRLDGIDAVSDMIGRHMTGMAATADAAPSADADAANEGSTASERGREGGGVGVEVVTSIDVMHGFFRYSFVWTLPDGTRSGGTDFCELAPDGRMSLITVWPANDEFPLPR
jgi:hypothetical protein